MKLGFLDVKAEAKKLENLKKLNQGYARIN